MRCIVSQQPTAPAIPLHPPSTSAPPPDGASCAVQRGAGRAAGGAAAGTALLLRSQIVACVPQAAPVALFSEELDALPGVLRLGRATRRTIHLNIAAAVLTKASRDLTMKHYTSLLVAVRRESRAGPLSLQYQVAHAACN